MTQHRANGLRRVDVQVSLFTIVVAVVACSILPTLYYHITHRDMLRGLADRVIALEAFVDNNLDPQTFSEINTPEDIDTPLYADAHRLFRSIQDVSGVKYLYSGKRDANGELVYVVDCIDPSAADFRSPGDPIEPEIVPEMTRALGGEVVLPDRIKSTDWGKIFIAYLPVQVDGAVLGVIGVEFAAEHQYRTYQFLRIATPVVAALICFLCALVARHLFRRISNPLYQDMVNTDYLTGLKSRNAFDVDLENRNASRRHEGVGMYVIDLNNLKKVNDTLGHARGDQYLQLAAKSFRDTAGTRGALYRVGGDEFVLMTQNDTPEAMESLVQQLAADFAAAMPQWGIDLSFSIGCALYTPADTNLTATYRRADGSMYEQKRHFHARTDCPQPTK